MPRASRPDAAPAGRALAVALALPAAAHLLLGLAPSMRFWGLADLVVAPGAWLLWLVAALALIPLVGRVLARPLAGLGDALTDSGARGGVALTAWAATVAAFALALDDRGYFVGDFLLRLGSIRQAHSYGHMFPQALPLDVLLHDTLAVAFVRATHADPLLYERLLGALRAAGLGLLSAALARTLRLRGAPAGATAVVATASGALALGTGYGKGLADLALLAAAAAVAAMRVATGAGGLGPLAALVALALPLHRSAVALLPLFVVTAALALRRDAPRRASWRDRASLALPVLALVGLGARLFGLLTGYDRQHLLPAGAGPAQALAFAFEPRHLLDAVNALLLVAPATLAGLVAALDRRAVRGGRIGVVLFAAALPFALELLLVHPRQGMVRDWDVFATAGAVISIAAATALGAALATTPSRAWLAPAVALGSLAPVGAMMLRAHDADAALAFARRALAGPPQRPGPERASLHQYLAISLAREQRTGEAAAEFRAAALEAPTEVQLVLWLRAALGAHDLGSARDALDSLATRFPSGARWLALSRAEESLGRLARARDAARRAVEAAPRDTLARAWAKRIGALDAAEPPVR